MSRIGRMPIPLPDTVQATIEDHAMRLRGPKGELAQSFHPDMRVEIRDKEIIVSRPTDSTLHRSLHGLTRTLLANAVKGVTDGFSRTIEITGVGYRAQLQGEKLVLQLGFSHPVEVVPPKGIQVTNVETFSPTSANEWLSSRFVLNGIDKEALGEFAAQIRALRKVEPYKGKGIKYAGERVRRKAGKSAGKSAR
ncbi:MAG: 50S ribosomal protein L6 [Chloroflexi bacterium]|nr:50S ribosomal protein L6 [Chloroflexota bacterium]